MAGQQQEEIETIRSRTIEVKLSDADVKRHFSKRRSRYRQTNGRKYLTVWDSRKKFQPWDDCSITKPKPKHAASLTLH